MDEGARVRPRFDRRQRRRGGTAGAEHANRETALHRPEQSTRRDVEAPDVGIVSDQLTSLEPKGVHRADASGDWRQAIAAVEDALLVWNGDVAGGFIAGELIQRVVQRARGNVQRLVSNGQLGLTERRILKAR